TYLQDAADRGSIGGRRADVFRRDVSNVLGFYYEDLRASLAGNFGDEGHPGIRGDEHGGTPVEGHIGPAIGKHEAQELVGFVWADGAARDQLLQAARAYGEAALRNAGEHATGGSGITQSRDGDPVTRAMWKYGKELGRLIGSTDDADVDTSRAVPVISEYDRPVVSLAAAGTSLKLGPVGSPAVAAFTQV